MKHSDHQSRLLVLVQTSNSKNKPDMLGDNFYIAKMILKRKKVKITF